MAKASKITELTRTDGKQGGLIPAADFKEAVLDGGFKIVRDFKFEIGGPGLHGYFVGEGGPIEMTDEKTGEVKVIRTWQFRDPVDSIIWQAMGSHGLEKYVSKLAPGAEVMISLVGQKEVGGGRRMNDFVVGVK